MSFGTQLKRILRIRKIRQKELALMLGCTDQTVSFWITGHSRPRADQLQKLLSYLGISEADLEGDAVPGAVAGAAPAKRLSFVPVQVHESARQAGAPESLLLPESVLSGRDPAALRIFLSAEGSSLVLAEPAAGIVSSGLYICREGRRFVPRKAEVLSDGSVTLSPETSRPIRLKASEVKKLRTEARAIAVLSWEKQDKQH